MNDFETSDTDTEAEPLVDLPHPSEDEWSETPVYASLVETLKAVPAVLDDDAAAWRSIAEQLQAQVTSLHVALADEHEKCVELRRQYEHIDRLLDEIGRCHRGIAACEEDLDDGGVDSYHSRLMDLHQEVDDLAIELVSLPLLEDAHE